MVTRLLSSDEMADLEEKAVVKKVIENLHSFLQINLSIDEDFVLDLQEEKLLHKRDADRLRASLSKGGSEALYSLLEHIGSYYDEEMLEKLCTFVEEYSERRIRPSLRKIAVKIRNEMKRHKQPDRQQQDGVPGPTVTGPPSSPPATQGEPTPTVSTMDERSQKIKRIVDMYRSESTEVNLPEIPELEDDFDDIMIALNTKLSSADPKVICKLHGTIRVKYRRYIHGVKPVELPSIPNTAGGLYDFIAAKSTPYEILLVHHAVDVLETEDLKGTLQSYESNLGNHLRQTLESYKKRKVTLPRHTDCTHLAVVLSKEQILLSLVLHIKEYLTKYLQLEETIFKGFGEGCTVLFYSILKVDAVLLASKILSHSAELKRMFDITHLVVFDYIACDLERAIIELPVSQGTALLKVETSLEETKASLDETQMNYEQLQHKLIATRMKHEVEKEELEKEKEMFKRSNIILARKKDELEEKLRQLAVEKKDEVDSMLKVLRIKQEELEGDEFLPSILERDKREAALKEEIATLKKTLEEKENTLQQKDAQLKQKDAEVRHKNEESGRRYAILLHEHQQLQQERDQVRHGRHQLQQESRHSLSAKPVVKKPTRNWKDMKCQKILKCGGHCDAVATKGNHIAVSIPNNIKVYDKSSTKLLHTVGKGQLGGNLPGIVFYDQENVLVSDADSSSIKMFTIQGQHVRTIDRGSTTFKPLGITISPDGHIYVCDAANDCVCVFDVNGKFIFSFGSRGSGDECFNWPVDLCFASDDFLHITDVGNSRICVYDKNGNFIGKFTTTCKPWCIDATDCGHLIVSSFVSHNIMIYTTGGDLVHVFGERGSELGQFLYRTGISVDSDGLIYIADCCKNRIEVF